MARTPSKRAYKVEAGRRSDLKPTGSWFMSYGKKAGKVGLWTKADSGTAFDDFPIKSYDAD
jgi:hypothetical protein